MGIKVDPELKSLCRQLRPDERSLLESNLLEFGCLESIQLWNDFIVDGHNRFEICTKQKIPYRTVKLAFGTKEDVMLHMINNQMGRRNLSDLDKVQLLERKRPLLEAQAKERLKTNTGGTNPQPVPNLAQADPKPRVRDQLAQEAGVSKMVYSALKTINERGSDELKEAVREKKIGATTAGKIAVLPKDHQGQMVERVLEKKQSNKNTTGENAESKTLRLTKAERENVPSSAEHYVSFAKCQIEKIQKGDKSAVIAINNFISWLENFKGGLV